MLASDNRGGVTKIFSEAARLKLFQGKEFNTFILKLELR